MPLRTHDAIIGAIALCRAGESRPYDEDDKRLVEDLADRAALAIDNARLYGNLERRVRARTADLEAANKELEAFSYSVSHDLRAPLRAIDGFGQALLDDCSAELPERGKDHVRRMRSASQRMGTLIDDLIELARLKRKEMMRDPVDLSALAMAAIADIERARPELSGHVKIEPGLRAHGDARMLRILLDNLLGNAVKFTNKAADPRISVDRIQVNDDEWAFRVKDNGVGFDMRYADKLFVPFQRLHTAREYEGTGIGLATGARIVTRHGGRIWATGDVGNGATFWFTLGD